MKKISGNTLYVEQESGNIGHYFNDHVYSSFSYYLENKNTIDNICIEFTDLNLPHAKFIEHFNNKLLLDGRCKRELNFNMLIIFFNDCCKNIYFQIKNNPEYNFENLIKPKPDRYFTNTTNCLEVFNKLRSNYSLYTQQNNIINERIDVALLYRTDGKERNIYNIEKIEDVLKINNIKYKLFKLSDYYNFQEIVDIFYNSDNIISFYGCELTYCMFMNKNTQIIELTSINHIENWWKAIEGHYINYGLKYTRHSVNVIDNNLYLNNEICFDILLLFIKLNISFFGASITEQKEGYVHQIKKIYENKKNINIFQNGYGARYISDAGIINIEDVLKEKPNYCFIDWFSTLLICDISELQIYLDTIIYKFTQANCKLIFIFFPRKDMSCDRIKMYNSVQNYLTNNNISFLDLSNTFNDSLEIILKDCVHTTYQGGIEYSEKILNYFKQNFTNIYYPLLLPKETKFCNYLKKKINITINNYIKFEGECYIVAFKIVKNKYCGIVDIFTNDKYEKSFNFWDRWCSWERESLACSLYVNGKTDIFLTNKNVDVYNENTNIDWNNIYKKLEITEIYYLGNLNIIDFK